MKTRVASGDKLARARAGRAAAVRQCGRAWRRQGHPAGHPAARHGGSARHDIGQPSALRAASAEGTLHRTHGIYVRDIHIGARLLARSSVCDPLARACDLPSERVATVHGRATRRRRTGKHFTSILPKSATRRTRRAKPFFRRRRPYTGLHAGLRRDTPLRGDPRIRYHLVDSTAPPPLPKQKVSCPSLPSTAARPVRAGR